MKQFYVTKFLFLFLLFAGATWAQEPDPSAFSGLQVNPSSHVEEISAEQRKLIVKELQANVAQLKARGIISANRVTAPVKFIHPLRQAAGFNEAGYYGISNYIDSNLYNPGATGSRRDFNCGQRTYSEHYGTDFFLWPHPWKKMEEDAVEIVSAADGVIIARRDGIEDKNCAMCPANAPASCYLWNAVYVQNTDGTVCWYGHMKKGSVTTKQIGETVTQGEYLGVVGSSGNSSGPHLHFEVWQNNEYEVLIDPWKGTCNPARTESYWQNQEPYYMPMVNAVTSASGEPTPYSCYNNGNGEKPMLKDTFTLGETVYLPVYLRDNLAGRTIAMKLIRPSGAVLYNYNIASFNQFYSDAWFRYIFTSSVINEGGDWKFSVQYGNNTVVHTFTVVNPLPLKLLNFSAKKSGTTAKLAWQTAEEVNTDKFIVEHSNNGQAFKSIGTVKAKGNNTGSLNKDYSFDDNAPLNGTNYYRLKMMDMDGSFTYSPVQLVGMEESKPFSISPSPAQSIVYIKGNNIQQVQLIDNAGRIVLNESVNNQSVHQLSVSHLAKGLYMVNIKDKEGNRQTEKLIIQ